MKKFKLYIILIAIFLLILFLAIIAFYSIPYTKCNSLILFANKNETGFSFENENDPFISKSDFDKLVVLPEDETDEDTYVKIRSTKKLSFSAINQMEIKCHIITEIINYETFEKSGEYEADVLISFIFEDFKWKVNNVTTIN